MLNGIGLSPDDITPIREAFLSYAKEPTAQRFDDLVLPALKNVESSITSRLANGAEVMQGLQDLLRDEVLQAARQGLYMDVFRYFHEVHSRRGQWKFYQRHVNECGFDYLRTSVGDLMTGLSPEKLVAVIHLNVMEQYGFVDGHVTDRVLGLRKFNDEWASMQNY